MSAAGLAVRVVDADTHLTEPVDLWTARMPERFRSRAPKVTFDEGTRAWRWQIGDHLGSLVANYSVAGWHEFPPSCPPTLEEANPAAYDVKARLAHMDTNGIFAQVLYPNILAFEGFAIMALKDEQLKLACVRTYNDYQAEFASAVPERFITLAVLPFWDLEESVKEIRRCHAMGHRGVLWAATLDKHGLPDFIEPHWDPLYAVAQELGMSMNFHVGVGETGADIDAMLAMTRNEYNPMAGALRSTMFLLGNSQTIGKLVFSDVCDRFPKLNFVSVESGFGYLPFLLEALDWNWCNVGGTHTYPSRLMPSEYFRRQVYGMFWFESEVLSILPRYQDNIMFETDFPHPTCLHPGPASVSPSPAEVIDRATGIVGVDIMRKILYDNAARVYHLD